MKAVLLHAVGGPDALHVADVATPDPADGQVLVRVEAVGVNFRETQVRAGVIGGPLTGPVILGNETVGVVSAVGAGADPALVGRRVVALTDGLGAYAEYVVATAADLVAVPDGLAPAEAAAVAVQGTTALGVLRMARIGAADSVLIEAASAGVGGYLVQLVAGLPHGLVIGTAGNPAKRTRAVELGADVAVDHTGPDWPGLVSEALDGRTLDVALEAIGGQTAVRVFDLLTPASGRMVLYGRSAGQWPPITAEKIFFSGVTLSGFGGAGFAPNARADLTEILDRVAARRIQPLIDQILPLTDAAEAHKRIDERTAMGKLILVP
jgi:NADPH:quinone reductase